MISDAKNKLAGIRIRSNAVLAIEVLISASPSYFREDVNAHGTYDENRLKKWRKATEAFIKKEFPDAVSVVLHLDESTPHYQIIDIPLDKKTGRLNARSKYGGRATLAKWQDKAAEAVEHLGIERGVRGSTAKHTTIKDFYAALESAGAEIPELIKAPKKVAKIKPRTVKESIPFSEAAKKWEAAKKQNDADLIAYEKNLNAHQESIKSRNDYVVSLAKNSKALALENQRLKAENERLKASYAHDRAIADHLRRIPAHKVLEKLYGASKKGDKCTLPDGSVIKVTQKEDGRGDLWVFHGTKAGGRGAMNLVMKLSEEIDYKGAVALLAQNFGVDSAVSEQNGHLVAESIEQRKETTQRLVNELNARVKKVKKTKTQIKTEQIRLQNEEIKAKSGPSQKQQQKKQKQNLEQQEPNETNSLRPKF